MADRTEDHGEPPLAIAVKNPETGEANDPLSDAAADLEEALQHKSNWIPAQIYLAQVYQALPDRDKASEELSSILGDDSPPAKASSSEGT